MTADCATRPDLDWHSPADYPRAAAICAGCSERAVCEAGARARGEEFGCWGGWIADAPDADTWLLDGIPEPAAVEVEHGTRTRRNAGCTCRRCLEAHRSYVAAWREGRVTRAEASTAGEQLDLWETA